MNSFKIVEYGPTGGDQCSPYYIEVSPGVTVGDVVEDILSNKDEWGIICIEQKDNNHAIEYKYGELLKNNVSKEEQYFWNNLVDWKVVKMRGSGGWSNSDYWLTIQSGE